MAKSKKSSKELTLEEKLEQALVPAEEQPYGVPKNWCWVRVGCIAEIYTGNSVNQKTKDEKYKGQKTGFLFIATKDIGFDNEIHYETNLRIPDFNHYKIAPANTALLCIEGGSAGRKVGFVTQNVCFGNNLQSQYFIHQFNRKKHGLIGGVSVRDLADIKFMLPPIAEQQRIVVRIENLFAKLDTAKEKIQDFADNFKFRRAAVLHKAFTGELSKQWRNLHGIGMDSWKQLSVSALCHSLKYGTSKKSEKSGRVVVVRMGNLQQGEIDWSNLAYSNDKEDIEKYKLKEGDVLFNRTNSSALVGKTSIYRGGYPAIYAGYLIKLDYKRDIITGDFLNYALNTNHAKDYCNLVKTDGVNQSNINAKKIGAYVIPVPEIEEQTAIVEVLDKFFEKERQAKEFAESVLEQMETIKKSILARAFRGSLGTNHQSDENSIELLKKILIVNNGIYLYNERK